MARILALTALAAAVVLAPAAPERRPRPAANWAAPLGPVSPSR